MFWFGIIIGVWIASLVGILLFVASIVLSGKSYGSDNSHSCTSADIVMPTKEDSVQAKISVRK